MNAVKIYMLMIRKPTKPLECITKSINRLIKLGIVVIGQKMIDYKFFEFCSWKLKKVKLRIVLLRGRN